MVDTNTMVWSAQMPDSYFLQRQLHLLVHFLKPSKVVDCHMVFLMKMMAVAHTAFWTEREFPWIVCVSRANGTYPILLKKLILTCKDA